MKTKRTRLVIFDLDGVLIDSHDAWYESWKESFSSVGKQLSAEDFDKHCWGSVFPVACKRFGFTREECKKGSDALLNAFLNKNIDKVKVFPGVIEVLSMLSSRGIKKALVTNNSKGIVGKVAGRFGLNFDLIVDLSKVRPKPDPEGIDFILGELEVGKDEAVFIGDTDIDEQTGRNAGVRTFIIGKDIDNVADILKLIS